ncbi:PREDICTED: uncharacterized protein LOC109174819 [Ipomoea nil]|uniref:uncharacterized protein LOC109174819 n=1 Tax=Ipomoea nil TaxID=35883 RepID=UPI000900C6CD|nr:PREDICTED: uncharacterized protein LOC109174819 [Ipomoea nil]
MVEANLRSTPTHALNIAACLWVIWLARNERVWNDTVWPLSKLRNDAKDLVTLWTEVYVKPSSRNSRHLTHPAQFSTGRSEFVLHCNVDAAMAENVVGYGAVIRDYAGQFVAACSANLSCEPIPYLAESLAVREMLLWLKSRSIQEVLIESDCQSFCTSFNSQLLDLSYVGLIVKQCQSIARDMGNVRVRHVRRSGNHVAHALARATVSLSVLGVWNDHPPHCIAHLF